MFKLANGIAETTPAIIDRKFKPFSLILMSFRRITEENAHSRVGAQARREEGVETHSLRNNGRDTENAENSIRILASK